jgi:hypothetical protein
MRFFEPEEVDYHFYKINFGRKYTNVDQEKPVNPFSKFWFAYASLNKEAMLYTMANN